MLLQWRIQDFPLGGADLQCIHISAKTYVKTKEMDPVGGGVHAGGAPWIRQCTNLRHYCRLLWTFIFPSHRFEHRNSIFVPHAHVSLTFAHQIFHVTGVKRISTIAQIYFIIAIAGDMGVSIRLYLGGSLLILFELIYLVLLLTLIRKL